MPTETFVDELWEGQPPTTALKGVQVYVSHLRKALDEGLLRRGPPATCSVLSRTLLDAALFESLLARGQGLLADDPRGAGELLREALDFGAAHRWRSSAISRSPATRSADSKRSTSLRSSRTPGSRSRTRPARNGRRRSSRRSRRSIPCVRACTVSSCSRSTGPAGRPRRSRPTSGCATRWSSNADSSPARHSNELEHAILVQDPALDLPAGSPPTIESEDRVQLVPTRPDLGEHRLKDIPGAVSIFQLGSERFPPLKTISNTNLPVRRARSSAGSVSWASCSPRSAAHGW